MATEMRPLSELRQVLLTGRPTEAVISTAVESLRSRESEVVGSHPEAEAERTVIRRAVWELEQLQEELRWLA